MYLKLRDKILLTLIIFIGIFLRVFQIASKSFWCDEFLAISLSKLNIHEMLGWIIRNDAHPPLFYLIMHFLFNFTQSEVGLRILPAIFGSGAIILFYLMLKQMRSGNYLLSLSLFVLSPAAVLWSQTVKSYSMLTFFSLLSVLMFFNFGRTRRSVYAFGWIISSLIAVYLHNYGVMILLTQAVMVCIRKKDFPPKVFLLPLLIILLGYLPYLCGPLMSQIAFVKGATHTVTNPFLRLVHTFYYFVFGETLSPLNARFVLPGAVLFLLFFGAGLFGERNFLWFFSSLVLVAAVVVTFVIRATIPQNLIHLQPFFFIVVSSGLEKIFKGRKRVIFACLLALSIVPPLHYYYRGDSSQYHDAGRLVPYRQIMQMIEGEGRMGEAIIVTEQRERRFSRFFEPYSPWDWYYKGSLPVIEVTPATVPNLERELADIREKYDGFWLILSYGFVEHQWNDRAKNFFSGGKSVKMKEIKLVKNYSFLDILRGKGKHEYYFVEVYHFIKADHD